MPNEGGEVYRLRAILGRILPLAIAATACGLLIGCASTPRGDETIKPTNGEQVAGEPDRSQRGTGLATGDLPKSQVSETKEDRLQYRGVKRGKLPSSDKPQRLFLVDTLQLNFVNADAADVVRALINDVFGEPVAIAQGVSARITLTSPEAIPTRQALQNLDDVLAASGLTLIEGEAGFLLSPLTQARGRTAGIDQEVGFTKTLIRIENTTPSAVVRLAQAFKPTTIEATAEDEAGVVIVEGPKGQVQTFVRTLQGFDLPSLNDSVFGMFSLRHADASSLAEELEAILPNTARGAADLITVIPLPRLNQIFVLTTTSTQFKETAQWIERLDQPAEGDERRLYYYTVQNAPANQLATQLAAAYQTSSNIGLSRGNSSSPNNIAPSTGSRSSAPGTRQNIRTPRSSSNTFPSVGGNANGLSIVSDELNNGLIIRATGSEYRDLLSLLERMDVLAPQVLIEATIAEVTLTDDLQYGVRWFLEDGKAQGFFPARAAEDASSTGSGPPDLFAPVAERFNFNYVAGPNAGIAIDALASVTDVEVISAPSIMVQNNQTANLQVGDQVPIITQSSQGVANPDAPIVSNVQLVDTGIILQVKPRINASGVVVLEVEQEVSDAVQTITSGIDSPTIQQRQFTSTIAVRDGGTVILGGLIRESRTDNDAGLPVLRRIPILGNLFKSRSNNRRRTELIIFLKPRIIRNDTQAQEALDEFQQRLEFLNYDSKGSD